MNSKNTFHEIPQLKSSTMPAKMVAITLVVIAVMMTILSFINQSEGVVLISFAMVLYAIAGLIFFLLRRTDNAQSEQV